MKNAYIKFILAAVIFGTNGIIASHIPLSSYEIVLTRTVLGGFFLLILATARREWGSLRRASRASLVWLVLSGLFLSGNWLFLYELPAYRRQPGNPHVLLRAHPDHDPVVLRLP